MGNILEPQTRHPFSADRPISRSTEDLLGRLPFAKSMAEAIKGWQEKDSLVIALYGQWGSGKTSLKNMILESFNEGKGRGPLVVEFNPWHWSGRDQLLRAFFHEIGLPLGQADTSTKKNKDRVQRWQRYGAYLSMGASLASSLKEILPLFVPGAGLACDIAEKGLQKSSQAVQEGTKGLLSQYTETTVNSLYELKREITEDLRSLKRPILIVMDDIDRLTADEIRALFQIVKANADFPNLIYLLLFQRDVIEKSLDNCQGNISGRDFLEKIVQVGFDVPLMERSKLERVLFTKLDELLNALGENQQFDERRWANIFIPGIRPYFQSLRDVNRFVATLSFHISLFRNGESFEVNPIDLIALEVMRVFESAVYQRIPEAKSILTGISDSSSDSREQQEADKALIQSIIEQASPDNQPHVKEILKELFPRVEGMLGGFGFGTGYGDSWYRELRVCHEGVFQKYFHFSIPEGDISQHDLDRILKNVGNHDNLVEEFRALNNRNLLGTALNRLESYKEKVAIKHALPFVTAIFDIGDELPEKPPGFYVFGYDTHAYRIIYFYLMQEKDASKRAMILKKAMEASKGLYLPIDFAEGEIRRHERDKSQEKFLVDEKEVKPLKAICLKKIVAAAKSGLLRNHKRLLSILYSWRAWQSPEAPQAWVKKLVQSREGLLIFLKAVLQSSASQGMGDYVAKITWYIRLQTIDDFIPLTALERKINKIDKKEISPEEKRAIDAFYKALKRRQAGKADDDWRHEEEEEEEEEE
jgi:predicted KAP-like P-loop ATPase